ncbi:50S ribosomal protein L10 [Sulfurihydrogenibium azorense]|jgi:large subunit ribosomal protein L10|uniref:Large ribosomal subunit protein uL10 n=1 Tax=Sulfurihydrogenibium azorense (strain DSM 15241 / OCM 825 / Az-Fu1) TaxID=204536 RepID=C1DX85_SULAA|nr:50S ribosomal protein L10 [Sulfurihydrogenibium azorense]ACN98161.1 ribosomal protein L10 [Sulfurihydrogenibium azorense Az-Fu1]MDM7272924.1 50S ribosomal protein L10 [Sulfurihydrogenibium azorense]
MATLERKSIQKKAELVKEIKEKIEKSPVVILLDFKGIDANSITDFRKQLKKNGAEMKVVKNTLLYRACNGTQLYDKIDIFKEQTAVIFGYEDPVAPAKLLKEFLKGKEEAKVKGGLVEGVYADPQKIEYLASLPTKEVLVAQLLAVLQAPITNFVRVLNAIPQKAVLVLDAIRKEKEKQS